MKQQFHFPRLWFPLLTGVLLISFWTMALARSEPGETLSIPQEVQEAVATGGEARVLLLLQAEGENGRLPDEATIRQDQDALLDRFEPGVFTLGRRYRALPALSGQISAAGLRVLETSGQVAAIQLDQPGGGHLGQSVPALQADSLHHDYGLTGAGVTVAVVDSGVDTAHPDIADDLIAQHCFTTGNCPPHDGDEGSSAEDEQGHGTNVASVITARGVVAGPGFAPDAEIVAVRVLDQNNSGWVSDWVAGLDWLLVNQPSLGVDIINMSLGTWVLYPDNCDAQQPVLAYAISRLNALGITLFASSGNQGAANAMAAPACNSGIVAVGATYDGNLGREPDPAYGNYHDWFGANWPECYDAVTSLQTITCFTNSSEMLDLLAPGARIAAGGLYGQRWTFVGTSQAAPTAAGIAALMLQANEQLSPATIEQMLQASGPRSTDPRSGRQVATVNALAALRPLLPVAPATLSLTGPTRASAGVPYTFTATVAPTTATQPLVYRWEASDQPAVVQSGGLSQTASFTWAKPGVYTGAATVSNDAGQASASRPVTVEVVALTDVTISGAANAATGAPYTLQAATQPLFASRPITYSWQTAGQVPQVHSGATDDTALFTWMEPGAYTVSVTAGNRVNSVTRSHTVKVDAVAPANVTLAGRARGATGFAYTFTARAVPDPVSQPLTYTWQASDHPSYTVPGDPQATAAFTWYTQGVKQVQVAVANAEGSASQFFEIEIGPPWQNYLPVTGKR